MNRTSFLRLSRSCKWIHNTIQKNQKHIRNYVSKDRITITIHRPRRRPNYANYPYRQNYGPPPAEVQFPPCYKLTVEKEQTNGEFEPSATFYYKMKQFSGMRLAEMSIYSKMVRRSGAVNQVRACKAHFRGKRFFGAITPIYQLQYAKEPTCTSPDNAPYCPGSR